MLWFLVGALLVVYLAGIAIIERDKRNRKVKTKIIFTTIINKTQIKILSMQLQKQQFVESILSLVNKDTQEPVSGAEFSNIQLTSSDESVFTSNTDSDNDGIVDIVGVGEGTANLEVKADVKYTDPNTQQEVNDTKSATVEVTVTAPPPGAINTEMIVTFSEPQPTGTETNEESGDGTIPEGLEK